MQCGHLRCVAMPTGNTCVATCRGGYVAANCTLAASTSLHSSPFHMTACMQPVDLTGNILMVGG